MKFYSCPDTKSIITVLEDNGVPDKVAPIVPNSTDAAGEKHVPVVKQDGNKVTVSVGSVNHPMLKEHFIGWVVLETNKGFQVKYLKADDKPEAEFVLSDGEKVATAYSYCNLHGLWKD